MGDILQFPNKHPCNNNSPANYDLPCPNTRRIIREFAVMLDSNSINGNENDRVFETCSDMLIKIFDALQQDNWGRP